MTAIRHQYQQLGVRAFYEAHGATYRNPHEAAIAAALTVAHQTWALDLRHVLDLACGSGEATLTLQTLGAEKITGVDPFTAPAYQARTGAPAQPWTFEQIAAGALAGQRYTSIVCSYALHLLEGSRLPQLCWQLSQLAPTLLILTPHQRPHIKADWGWHLAEEIRVNRVRVRLYKVEM